MIPGHKGGLLEVKATMSQSNIHDEFMGTKRKFAGTASVRENTRPKPAIVGVPYTGANVQYYVEHNASATALETNVKTRKRRRLLKTNQR